MPSVQANGINVFYREAGEGEPVLLIQGLEVDHRGWAAQVPALKPYFRCISFDNRDIGQTDFVPAGYTIRDMAGDAVGVLDALGIERAHVVGFSMGGSIAQRVAIEHPERVNKLALLSTLATGDGHFRALNEGRSHQRAALDLETYTRASFPLVYTARDYAVPGQVEDIIQRVIANPTPQPNEAFARQIQALTSYDGEGDLGRITAPTLILCGDEDVLTPPRFSRILNERIKDSKLVLVHEAGHGVIWTRADEVNEALLNFLRA